MIQIDHRDAERAGPADEQEAGVAELRASLRAAGRSIRSEISSAAPRATYSIPSVAMKGATLNRVTRMPFTSPTSVPTASETSTTTHTAGYSTTSKASIRSPCSSTPATTPESPSVDPTDRSMPPLRMTNSMPSARIAFIATCLVIVMRFDTVRNESDSSANTMISTISAMNARPRAGSADVDGSRKSAWAWD